MVNAFSGSLRGVIQGQREQEADNDQWKPGPGGILVPKTLRAAQSASHEQRVSEANMDQPASLDQEGWKRYWQERGQPWRWEPEISKKRQEELEQRRGIQADPVRGIYPFGGMTLTRADIEWLLATHEGGQGPIDWSQEEQRAREGIDLRGGRVEEGANLEQLPLAKLRGGFIWVDLFPTEEQMKSAMLNLFRCNLSMAVLAGANLVGAMLDGTNLRGTMLEGADLGWAILEGTNLRGTTLEGTNLRGATLAGANLRRATLAGANLRQATLAGANLRGAMLENADFRGAMLEGANLEMAMLENAELGGATLKKANLRRAMLAGADLRRAMLENADLGGAILEKANLAGANLENADLNGANLENAHLIMATIKGANLAGANLENARLGGANLENANLRKAKLEGANLRGVTLAGANLAEAMLEGTDLRGATLVGAYLRGAMLEGANLFDIALADIQGIGPTLADVWWEGTKLTVVNWASLRLLGDEHYARQSTNGQRNKKDRQMRQSEYQKASRANHQLAVALQDQGLTDDAARFAYRAKCLRRYALWHELLQKDAKHKASVLGSLLFSWLLFLLAGYGYRLRWCLLWPAGLVTVFAFLYWMLDPIHMPWWIALGESVNVFHGRGAAPNIATLAHPVWFTAFCHSRN